VTDNRRLGASDPRAGGDAAGVDYAALMALWAKLPKPRGESGYHPLLYHLLDVAAVAEAMWQEVLTPQARQWIAERIGLSVGEAGRWIAFLAAVHDVGKASPVFARQDPALPGRLRGALEMPPPGLRVPHGVISTVTLTDFLPELGVSEDVAERLAVVVGGHHGRLPIEAEVSDAREQGDALGRRRWHEARAALIRAVACHLDVPGAPVATVDNAAAFWLAGLVSVADWIGSNQAFFALAVTDTSVPAFDPGYLERAREHAHTALLHLGWLAQPKRRPPVAFSDLFPFTPNGLQRAVIALAQSAPELGLVIIEAPFGVGKTEAALWLADAWGRQLGQRGFYIGLPTQATSNQMFERTRDFLLKRFPEDALNVQLLHGHAALSSEFRTLREEGDRLFDLGEIYADEQGGTVAAAEWFTHRKRGLLAPFGVGTVDQALMASLQTRHVFVRLFGLAHRTVVIDEVHAYDTYMSTLLDRLLEWLAALGSTVVLLSATLPDARRRDLAEAYARGLGVAERVLPAADYPRLTAIGNEEARSLPLHLDSPDKIIAVRWVTLCPEEGATFQLGEQLTAALRDGGAAAVICNTVRRAQTVYSALRAYFPGTASDGAPELDLLHARFVYEDRMERENRTLRRFGKGTAERPHRAVLVATQIVEQSLDLDFDLLVTDLAPIDFVLQRCGRLHRHDRGPRRAPEVWIGKPAIEGGAPHFDRGSELVYDEHVLLRSWLALRDRPSIAIPRDVSPLIEEVYGDAEPPADGLLRARWIASREERAREQSQEEKQGALALIRGPDYREALAEIQGTVRVEDSPESHPSVQARTRLGELSIPVVLLEERAGEPVLPDGTPLSTGRPDLAEVERLLFRSVSLNDRRVVHSLAQQPVPSGWARSPLLRDHRPVVLRDGSAAIGRCIIRNDPNLGVLVEEIN